MDGLRLHVPRIAIDGRTLSAKDFARLYRDAPLHLDTT